MISQATLATVSKAIADINFTDQDARFSELQALEIEQETAFAAAVDRRDALGLQLLDRETRRDASADQRQGAAIADALLAGMAPDDALDAGPSDDAIRSQRDALNLAALDRRRRQNATVIELAALPSHAVALVAPAIEALVPDVIAKANSAIAVLADCFAAMKAIEMAGGTYNRRDGKALDAALFELASAQVFSVPISIDVPADVQRILTEMNGRSACVSVQIPDTATRRELPLSAIENPAYWATTGAGR